MDNDQERFFRNPIFVCVFILVLGYFLLILRDTVFNRLSIAGGKPDFILILTVFYAIFQGYQKGGLMGLALGFLEDLMAGRFLGINALCKGIIGMIFGLTAGKLYRDNFLVPIICLLLSSLCSSGIYFVLAKLIGSNIYFGAMLLTAVANSIYTACFGPILYVLVYLMNKKEGE